MFDVLNSVKRNRIDNIFVQNLKSISQLEIHINNNIMTQ